ncbi:hypothetical protein ACFFYR_19070 [Paraburkholderia dipogonis]|nr:hypothetical protein [Paraburkholderia dipogonis]
MKALLVGGDGNDVGKLENLRVGIRYKKKTARRKKSISHIAFKN